MADWPAPQADHPLAQQVRRLLKSVTDQEPYLTGLAARFAMQPPAGSSSKDILRRILALIDELQGATGQSSATYNAVKTLRDVQSSNGLITAQFIVAKNSNANLSERILVLLVRLWSLGQQLKASLLRKSGSIPMAQIEAQQFAQFPVLSKSFNGQSWPSPITDVKDIEVNKQTTHPQGVLLNSIYATLSSIDASLTDIRKCLLEVPKRFNDQTLQAVGPL